MGRLLSEPALRKGFVDEMQRFLPASALAKTYGRPDYWDYLIALVKATCDKAIASLAVDNRPCCA